MRVKLGFVLVVCVMALASTSASAYWARTWDFISGYTSPEPALEGTDLWVGVVGQWPTEAAWVPDYGTLTVSGHSIFLDLYDFYSMQTAFPGPTDFDLGGYVGVLAPGWYNLYVAQQSNTWPLPIVEMSYVRGDEYLMTFAVYYRGDINHDGYVNVGDLQALVAAWGSQANPPSATWNPDADVNGDGYVNVGDLQALVANWGKAL